MEIRPEAGSAGSRRRPERTAKTRPKARKMPRSKPPRKQGAGKNGRKIRYLVSGPARSVGFARARRLAFRSPGRIAGAERYFVFFSRTIENSSHGSGSTPIRATRSASGDKSLAPGSWVILSRTNLVKADRRRRARFRRHSRPRLRQIRSELLHGMAEVTPEQTFGDAPLKVEGKGDNKTFTVHLRRPKWRYGRKAVYRLQRQEPHESHAAGGHRPVSDKKQLINSAAVRI